MPLQFKEGFSRKTLKLDGSEEVTITPVGKLAPQMIFNIEVVNSQGEKQVAEAMSRIDTLDELNYFKNGGILQYVLRKLN